MMKHKIIKILLTILLIFTGITIIGSGIFIYFINQSFNEATKPITDISRYKEVINQFEPDSLQLVNYFPKQIPSEAKNARLYFLPGFLQGGTLFQLQMELPPEKIKTLQAQFRKKAKRKYIPGDEKNSSAKEEVSPEGLNVTFDYNLYISKLENQKFPPNYEILVLEDTRGAPEYDWNHSKLYGVAINTSNSEIVYWMEAW